MSIFGGFGNFFHPLSDPSKYREGNPVDSDETEQKNRRPTVNERLKEEFERDRHTAFKTPVVGFVLLVIILLTIALTSEQPIFFSD